MNLFDFTYCGNYNRRSRTWPEYPLKVELWGSPEITWDPERLSGKYIPQTV